MYDSYYGLKKKPFEITTDPDFLWLGEQHREALASLEYGIREDKGFILLTGDVGTGKTVLINRLVKSLNMRSVISTVPDPGLSQLDFFNFLAETFRFGRRVRTKGEFLALLKKFLLQSEANRRKVLLLIDEAQRLNHELLEEIRLLSNIELDNRRLINIFFVGQPEFNDILMQPQNKAIRQRISVRYHLTPLTEAETARYILHRMRVAGAGQRVFTADALQQVYALTDGNPRLINIICDRALLTGYSNGNKEIGPEVIRECSEELRLPHENRMGVSRPKTAAAAVDAAAAGPPAAQPRQFSFTSLVLGLLIAAVIVAVGYIILSGESRVTLPWSADEIAPAAPPRGLPSREQAEQQAAGTDQTQPGQPTAAAGGGIEIEPAAPPAEPPASRPAPQEPPQPPAVPKDAAAQLDLENIRKVLIHFTPNSNELPDEAFRSLDRFAEALKQQPQMDVMVKGYTDSAGSLSYNRSVSEFRANIVKSYLVGKGVDPGRVTAQGMGPEDPLASNATAEGRRLNRRVEIEFIQR